MMSNTNDDDKFNRKWWLNPMESEHLSDNDKRNTKRFHLWILIWGGLFFCVAKFWQPLSGGDGEIPLWLLPFLLSPVIAALFLINALVRFCCETTDELLRRMTCEALSIGFAVAFFIHVCTIVANTAIGHFALEGHLTFIGMIIGYFMSYVILCRKNCYV